MGRRPEAQALKDPPRHLVMGAKAGGVHLGAETAVVKGRRRRREMRDCILMVILGGNVGKDGWLCDWKVKSRIIGMEWEDWLYIPF